MRRDSGFFRINSAACAIWSIVLPSGRGQEGVALQRPDAPGRAQFAVVAVGVVVPDVYAVFDQIGDVGVAAQEPQQFVDHSFEEHLLGRQQRESLAQVEPHLMAEDAFCARARAVAADDAFGLDAAQKIEIGFHVL